MGQYDQTSQFVCRLKQTFRIIHLSQKWDVTPDEQVNYVGRVTIFDPWDYQEFVAAGLKARLPVAFPAVVIKRVRVLRCEHEAIGGLLEK